MMTPHGKVSIGHTCSAEDAAMAINSRIFKDWLTGMDNRFALSSITIDLVDFKKFPAVENVLFIRLRAQTAITKRRPEIVQLRGGTAVMLVNLICTEDNSMHTILVKQARAATGEFELVEAPAGMIDDGTFIGAAVREIEEELGLVFDESDLADITNAASNGTGNYFTSPGLLDESFRVYLAEKRVSRKELEKLRVKTFGVAGEGEHITLMIVPMNDVPKVTHDVKALVAWTLHNFHKMNSAAK